jgi:hypothetical protein
MIDEPNSDPKANDGAGGDDPVISPHIKFPSHKKKQEEAPPKSENIPAHIAHKRKNTFRRKVQTYWFRFTRVGPDRHVELLLAAAIAFFAWRQYAITKSNSQSSTEQMRQIIVAADRIDDAADSFSSSATGINNGVSDAVKKLDNQAKKMGSLAESSASQARSALTMTIDAQAGHPMRGSQCSNSN